MLSSIDKNDSQEEEEELRVQGPGVNEVSFCARPHHNVHRTLGMAVTSDVLHES
jgi:hypothetical protein